MKKSQCRHQQYNKMILLTALCQQVQKFIWMYYIPRKIKINNTIIKNLNCFVSIQVMNPYVTLYLPTRKSTYLADFVNQFYQIVKEKIIFTVYKLYRVIKNDYFPTQFMRQQNLKGQQEKEKPQI